MGITLQSTDKIYSCIYDDKLSTFQQNLSVNTSYRHAFRTLVLDLQLLHYCGVGRNFWERHTTLLHFDGQGLAPTVGSASSLHRHEAILGVRDGVIGVDAALSWNTSQVRVFSSNIKFFGFYIQSCRVISMYEQNTYRKTTAMSMAYMIEHMCTVHDQHGAIALCCNTNRCITRSM